MANPLLVSNPKLTMKINGGANGWSESHYYTSQVAIDNPGLVADALQLCRKRCAALDGVNAQLFDATLSLDTVNRDSNPVDTSPLIPDPVHGYVSLGGPDPSDHTKWAYQTVQMSWHIRMETANGASSSSLYLPGMPASVTQAGSKPSQATPPTPAGYLGQFCNELLNGSKWGALTRNFGGPQYPVSGITFTPAAGASPTIFTFQLGAPGPVSASLTAGNLIRLQGATYSTPQKRLRLNGTYTIHSYNQTTGLLKVEVPRVIVEPVWASFGTLQTADGAVSPYTAYNFEPMTHRKRGRPFGGGRGRR